MRSIESMQDFILTNHFEQDISKFFLWHFKFRFRRENRKYANAVCISQDGVGKNMFNYVFVIDCLCFFRGKKECFG